MLDMDRSTLAASTKLT